MAKSVGKRVNERALTCTHKKDKKRNRQKNRWTDRQIDRQADRQGIPSSSSDFCAIRKYVRKLYVSKFPVFVF